MHDNDLRPPAPRPPAPSAGGGRGITLVAQFADTRGYQRFPDGKTVSASFTLIQHALSLPRRAPRLLRQTGNGPRPVRRTPQGA